MLKKILKDVLPTIISFTLSGMYSVVDGWFVGKATGDVGLAAINIAWPVPAVIMALGIGIGAGGSVLLSNSRGKGDVEVCGRIRDNTIWLLGITGILVTAFFWFTSAWLLRILGAEGQVYTEARKYCEIIVLGSTFQVVGTGMMPVLRNLGQALGAMISMTAGFAVNIMVNYYLMFHAGMGIRGAAYGTVIAQMVVIVISFGFLYLAAGQRILFRMSRGITKRTVQLGITAFGMSIAPSVALIFTNLQCLRLGGDSAVACYAVISYIVFPVQNMLSGVGDGSQPLMSFFNGAGKLEELKAVKKIGYILAACIGAAAAAVSIFCSSYIGGWFGLSDKAESYFQAGMCISALAFVMMGITKFNVSCLNATLQVKRAAALTYVESLVVSPVLLYVIPVFFGLNGVWMTLPATAVCMLLIYVLVKSM